MGATATEQAARNEAVRVVERQNTALASGRGALWSPTIRRAIIAGMPLSATAQRTIDIRTIDRHLSRRSAVSYRDALFVAAQPIPMITELHLLPSAARSGSIG